MSLSATTTLTPRSQAGQLGGAPVRPYVRLTLTSPYLTGNPVTLTVSGSGAAVAPSTPHAPELLVYGRLASDPANWAKLGDSLIADPSTGNYGPVTRGPYPAGMFTEFRVELDTQWIGAAVSATVQADNT